MGGGAFAHFVTPAGLHGWRWLHIFLYPPNILRMFESILQ